MLSKYGTEASTVFDLLGRNEVDLTASVGWVLAHSPMMVTKLGQRIGVHLDADEVSVALEVADAEGRTDIELTAPPRRWSSRPSRAGWSPATSSC